MSILFCGMSIFLFGFFIHLIVWKVSLPKKQSGVLVKIFAVVFIGSLFIFKITFFEEVQLFLLYSSLVCAYIITYSAIEADSPTLAIVLKIAKEKGLEKEGLHNMLTNDILVKPRIEDLLRDELVFINEGRYNLTKRGHFFVSIFIIFRKLLGVLEKGG